METTTRTTTSLDLPAARLLRDALTSLLGQEQTAMADFLVAPLRDGRLCLTTTAELAKVLTEEDSAEVLPRFFGLSAREAREVVAELQPLGTPATRAVATSAPRLEVRRTAAPQGGFTLATAAANLQAPNVVPPTQLRAPEMTAMGDARRVEHHSEVELLTADLRRLHVTVSRQFLKKLDAARDGLSHSIHGATTEQVLEAALDLLLEKQARSRGQVKKPRATVAAATPTQAESPAATAAAQPEAPALALVPAEPPPPRRSGSRQAIPAAVRRAVWERDRGRCAWPLDGGGCCGSTHRLEFDHVVAWARDGAPTVDGIRLLCRRHTVLAARQAFGERCVGRYTGGERTGLRAGSPDPLAPAAPSR
jgi:hypothetical protein